MAATDKIQKLDIVEMIRSMGGEDFMVDIDTENLYDASSSSLSISNGILIILCRSNDQRFNVDQKEYHLSGCYVLILPENQIISASSRAIMEHISIIAVSMDYILSMPSPIDTNIFSYSRYISAIKLTDEKFDDLMSYFRFMRKESLDEGKYRSEIVRSIFYALILEIVGEYEKIFCVDAAQEIKADDLTDSFFRLLATNYRCHRSVKFYAEQLSLTPKYLSTAVKRVTGRPMLDWIHEAILIESKMLLRTTDLTVQQIADQLNFSSSSAFVQFIKKHTGSTPKKLR